MFKSNDTIFDELDENCWKIIKEYPDYKISAFR